VATLPAGEVTAPKENLAIRRFFLQNCAPWAITPNTRSITFVTRSCEYRSGSGGSSINSEKLFQKGLDTLRISPIKPATIIN